MSAIAAAHSIDGTGALDTRSVRSSSIHLSSIPMTCPTPAAWQAALAKRRGQPSSNAVSPMADDFQRGRLHLLLRGNGETEACATRRYHRADSPSAQRCHAADNRCPARWHRDRAHAVLRDWRRPRGAEPLCGCESGPGLRAAVHGVSNLDGLIPLALAVQQIVLMLLERTFGGSPKARPPWR